MKTFRAERRHGIQYQVLDRATNWKPIIQAVQQQ